MTGHLLSSAIKALNFECQGITPSLIYSQSFRAGGVTALPLIGFDTKTIQIMGRWSSDTFLTYIHHQRSAFPYGMSSAMATNLPFPNTQHLHVHPAVGDIILPQSPAPLLA